MKTWLKSFSLLGFVGASIFAGRAVLSAEDHEDGKGAQEIKISDREECKLAHINKIRSEALPHSLSWFITTTPGGVNIISQGNQFFDESTKSIVNLPGDIDPVSTPDGDFLTVPMNDGVYNQQPESDNPQDQKNGEGSEKKGPTKPKPPKIAEPPRTILGDPNETFDDSPHATPLRNIEEGRSETELEFTNEQIERDPELRERLIAEGRYNPQASGSDRQMSTRPPLKTGMFFFRTAELKDAQKAGIDPRKVRPALIDESFQGSYQSTAVLKGPPGMKRYRVINDGNWAEYEDRNGEFRKIRGDASEPCSGGGLRLQLPMLSKDGRYMSGFHPATKTTVIMELDESDPLKCRLVMDLGFPTGKVDFGNDNSRITFHIDNHGFTGDNFPNLLSSPDGNGADRSKDSIVLFLETGADRRIAGIKGYSRLSASPTPGTGTYYPRFTPAQDRIVAAHESRGKFSLEFFDLNNLEVHEWWTPKLGPAPNAKTLANFALGALWHESCWKGARQDIPSLTQQQFFVKNLDPESCARLVRKNWQSMNSAIKEQLKKIARDSVQALEVLSEADLLAACPANDASRLRTEAVYHHVKLRTQEEVSKKDEKVRKLLEGGEKMLSEKCMLCHANLPNKLAFDDMNADQVLDVAFKVRMKVMPPEGIPISDDERSDLQYFIMSKAYGKLSQ